MGPFRPVSISVLVLVVSQAVRIVKRRQSAEEEDGWPWNTIRPIRPVIIPGALPPDTHNCSQISGKNAVHGKGGVYDRGASRATTAAQCKDRCLSLKCAVWAWHDHTHGGWAHICLVWSKEQASAVGRLNAEDWVSEGGVISGKCEDPCSQISGKNAVHNKGGAYANTISSTTTAAQCKDHCLAAKCAVWTWHDHTHTRGGWANLCVVWSHEQASAVGRLDAEDWVSEVGITSGRCESSAADDGICLRASHTYKSSGWTAWDAHWKFEAPANHTIGRIESHHSNNAEDRIFNFGYSFISPNAYLMHMTSESHWTGWVNDWEGHASAQCGPHNVMTGIESIHNNEKEDRLWNIKCTRVHVGTYKGGVTEKKSWWTEHANGWDQSHFSFHPDEGDNFRILYGIDSYHDDNREDRRFKFGFKKFCLNF